MQIAVIGNGIIGTTLAAKWLAGGHTVAFGSREPQSEKSQAARKAAEGSTVLPIAEALAAAEVVLLAIPGTAVSDFATTYGAQLGGKIVIDATNKFGQVEINSLAAIRAAAPTAQLVRAFNSLGWENFANPIHNGVQVDLFYASAPGAAQAAIEELITIVGLRPILVGDLHQVALVDAVGALWVTLAFAQQRGRAITLKLLE